MPPSAIALILSGTVFHVAWNGLLKERPSPRPLGAALFVVGVAGSALALFLGERVPVVAVVFLVATVAIHALYFTGLGKAYGSGDLSSAYPVARGLGVALLPFLVLAAAGPALGVLGWAGIALVATGSVVEGASRDARTYIVPTIGVGVLIALYSFIDKGGVTVMSPLLYESLTFVGAGGILVVGNPLSDLRLGRASVLVALLSLASYLLTLLAFRLGPVAPLLAIRQVAIPMALLWALLRRERVHGRRLVASLLVLVGAVAVGLG